MGRIIDSLSKLKLNGDVSNKPFNQMTAKELITLFYHLAEVYDAEALLHETSVKKKLQVFKGFARLHSLIHLLPSVKEMRCPRNPKKCTRLVRLVNTLLDMLEDKYGNDLYTRRSWPVACKELPKIEHAFAAGQYNIENLNLNADAVPPGTTKGMRKSMMPGERTITGTGSNVTSKSLESPEDSGSKAIDDCKLTTKNTSGGTTAGAKAPPIVSVAADLGTPLLLTSADGTHDIAAGRLSSTRKRKDTRQEGETINLSKENPTQHPRKESPKIEDSAESSKTTKRKLEPSVTPESKESLKKLKTEHGACEQFIEALEDLSKVRPIVEVIGWSKDIFTNHKVWLTIRDIIFKRVLLGKELRNYQAKKIPTAAGTTVIVEKTVSEEDLKRIRYKLKKIMNQIKNVVPNGLSEKLKTAVNSSCENVTLRIRDMNEW